MKNLIIFLFLLHPLPILANAQIKQKDRAVAPKFEYRDTLETLVRYKDTEIPKSNIHCELKPLKGTLHVSDFIVDYLAWLVKINEPAKEKNQESHANCFWKVGAFIIFHDADFREEKSGHFLENQKVGLGF